MFNTGKCPKCGIVLTHVNIQPIDIRQNMQPAWNGVSYVCPQFSCQTILGVSIDPISIKEDLIRELTRALGRDAPRVK